MLSGSELNFLVNTLGSTRSVNLKASILFKITILFILFFETGICCIALAVLEVTL